MTRPGPLAAAARAAARHALLCGMSTASGLLLDRIALVRPQAAASADAAEALRVLEHAFNTGTLPPVDPS